MTPRPSGGDQLHRDLELLAAVAAQGAEDVAGDALAVHADEDGLGRRDVAHDQGDVLVGVDGGAVGVEREVAELRREDGLGDALDEALALGAVGDELVDADDLEAVLAAKRLRSGRRIIVPSGFIISQRTPAG